MFSQQNSFSFEPLVSDPKENSVEKVSSFNHIVVLSFRLLFCPWPKWCKPMTNWKMNKELCLSGGWWGQVLNVCQFWLRGQGRVYTWCWLPGHPGLIILALKNCSLRLTLIIWIGFCSKLDSQSFYWEPDVFSIHIYWEPFLRAGCDKCTYHFRAIFGSLMCYVKAFWMLMAILVFSFLILSHILSSYYSH